MNEDGLVFSGPMTQPEAELWTQNIEDHFKKNLIARKYEVQYALHVFYRECCNLVENASSHTRM